MARVGIGTPGKHRYCMAKAGPCGRKAERRVRDPASLVPPQIRRAETYKAMNALIQGSAARHTKLWMLACWREGIVPLLQMHDALDCSVRRRTGGMGRSVGPRSRHARSADADRPEVWPDLGRRQTYGEELTGAAPAPKQASAPAPISGNPSPRPNPNPSRSFRNRSRKPQKQRHARRKIPLRRRRSRRRPACRRR